MTTTINVNDASSPIDGDTDHDVLRFAGKSGTTGYSVVISEDVDGSFSGTVDILGQSGDPIEFSGIEGFAFETFINGGARNNDVVDATGVSSGLTLNTGIGDDTVDFGAGNDTYELPFNRFGNNVVDGNDGRDTLDLTALSGAQRRDLTFSGTNIHQTTAPKVEVNLTGDSVTFTDFETILSGGGADTFTGGYAHEGLQSIDMGNGSDVFAWLTFAGDELDIDAAEGNDTVNIGGAVGAGHSGLINGTVEGGTGQDTLNIGVTNGKFGATGFEVVIEDDEEEANAFTGTVAYKGVTDGPVVAFTGFEEITFSTFKNAKNENDVVDATGATDLTLNTGIGDDTVNFGSGDDTFVISKRDFGVDVVNGGDGHDTIDLSALTGAGRADFEVADMGGKIVVTRDGSQEVRDNNNITLDGFEAIKTGDGNDSFGNFRMPVGLKSIDMGGGNDLFDWTANEGDKLDINAGSRDDTVKIGGKIGAGYSGLIDGLVDGGDGKDTLAMNFTLGRGDGFEVIFDGNNSGTVSYLKGAGATTTFKNFEVFEFSDFKNDTTNDDRVDASASNANLTISTSRGDDTIIVGGGSQTLTGGIGADTFEFVGAFGKDTITDFDVNEDSLSGLQGVDMGDIKLITSGEAVQIRADNGILLLEGLTVEEVNLYFGFDMML